MPIRTETRFPGSSNITPLRLSSLHNRFKTVDTGPVIHSRSRPNHAISGIKSACAIAKSRTCTAKPPEIVRRKGKLLVDAVPSGIRADTRVNGMQRRPFVCLASRAAFLEDSRGCLPGSESVSERYAVTRGQQPDF